VRPIKITSLRYPVSRTIYFRHVVTVAGTELKVCVRLDRDRRVVDRLGWDGMATCLLRGGSSAYRVYVSLYD
jgi:hypothetical protein